MRKTVSFKTVITQDEDGLFIASCPAIPGCHSQGTTYEEAVEHVEEAIRLCLKVAEHDKEYRRRIDFTATVTPRFIGLRDISVPEPSFV